MFPSLRANGSRERAPDDRLNEAIRKRAKGLDCFVANAPRNDGNRLSGANYQTKREGLRSPPSVDADLFAPRNEAHPHPSPRDDQTV
jgi:hypothetical protein